MFLVARIRLWVRSLLRKEELDRELQQEMEFHLVEQQAEYAALGMDASEAEAAARRLFGSEAALGEECRDQRHTRWLEDFFQDIRYAGRSLAKSPGFALVAIVTLALGIGANTAFFATAYGILFRPLPYPDSGRLVDMENGIAGVGPVTTLRDLTRAVDFAGYIPNESRTLEEKGHASRIETAAVTWNLARVLREAPERGRWFEKAEERPGQNRVAVLSDRAWRTRFGADPAILGRHITLNEKPFEVVGVMSPGFAFPSPETELWVPVLIDPRDIGYVWGGSNLWPIGRLRENMPIASAQAELKPAIDRIRKMFPWRMPDAWGVGARITPRSESMVKDVRPKLFALSTASLLLLLIACGNVANLLLAHAVKREREFAMREALGARRGRLIRQLLTEHLVLASAGGIAGLLAAAVILNALPFLMPQGTPRLHEIVPDFVLLAAAGASLLLTAALFGIAPLLQTVRRKRAPLVGRAVTASRRMAGVSLVLIGVELALATTLLIGAGLMGRTLWQLARVDWGVRTHGVTTARIAAGPSRCATPEGCMGLVRRLDQALLELPGVRSVDWSNGAPLDQDISAMAVEVEGSPKPPGAPAYVLWNVSATPGYFRALGITLRAGREFTDADRQGAAPTMIISAATARRFWPHESAVGKRIRAMSDREWRTIVGVVGDVAQYSLTGFPDWIDGVQYVPFAQWMPAVGSQFESTVFLASTGLQEPIPLTEEVRRKFPDVVVSHVRMLEGLRADSVADQRSTAWLLALLAGLGLTLGAAGVYGVISHRAAQRRREIGIRIALGASARQVAGMVLAETLAVAAAGTATGVLAAFVLSHFLRAVLFGVTTHDSPTLAICPAVLLAAALLAALIPGVRASRTDPAETLREE